MCSLLRSEFVKVDDFRFFFFFCMRIHNQHAFTHPYRGLLVLAQGCRRVFCLFPSFLADLHARPALWNEVTREVALFAAIGEPSWSMSQRPNRLTWSIPFFLHAMRRPLCSPGSQSRPAACCCQCLPGCVSLS